MSVTIDIPKNIDMVLNQRSLEEHIDTISVLKQMIREGAELYLINQYSNGKTSKGKLAELLEMDMYEVNELLEKYNIKASISYDRFTRGIKTAQETAKSQKGRA
jgi:predicted HTH domain antitoxin